MYICSSHAKIGRNFFHQIDTGTITVVLSGKVYTYTVIDGIITEFSDYDTHKQSTLKVEYGVRETTTKNGKEVERIDYRPGSNRAKSSTYYNRQRRTGEDFAIIRYPDKTQQEVKVVSKFRGNSLVSLVVYKKGTKRILCKTRAGANGLKLFYPDGKLALEYNSKVTLRQQWGYGSRVIPFLFSLPYQEIYDTGTSANTSQILKSIGTLLDSPEKMTADQSLTRNLFDRYAFGVSHTKVPQVIIYNRDGSINTNVRWDRNKQIEGEFLYDNKKYYFIAGVPVSEKIYNTKPEDLDPADVIKINNAQLRASLLKKIGYEKLVQKLQGEVVDKTDQGYELIKFKSGYTEERKWNFPDEELMFLKVVCPSTGAYYVLRVPPTMKSCEEARQWTFGVDQTRRDVPMEFIQET